MPQISTCPRCQQPVTIPQDSGETSFVECPHCRRRFELAEALDFVAEGDGEHQPPVLRAVGPGEQDAPEVPGGSGQSSADGSRRELTSGGAKRVRCPCCREAFALESLLLAETDEPLGWEAVAALGGRGAFAAPSATSGSQLEFGERIDQEDHSEFRLQSADDDRADDSADAFEFTAVSGAGMRWGNGGSRPSADRRRTRRDRGGMKDLIGAVLGGVAGLLITYYLLNLIGGPRFDFLQMYLPGVNHTKVYRPGWLGGPPRDLDAAVDPGLDETLGAVVAPAAVAEPAAPPIVDPPAGIRVAEDEPPSLGNMHLDGDAHPSGYVGLVDPPMIVADEFGLALKAVADAMDAGGFTEDAYEAWCRLAAAVTLVDRAGGGPQLHNRLEAVRRLVKRLSDNLADVGRMGSRRLRVPSPGGRGVLLAGTANKPNTPRGGGYLMGLHVAGTGDRPVVASAGTFPVRQDDSVVVLGYIIDHPREAIQGIDTDLPQVVWSCTVLAVAE